MSLAPPAAAPTAGPAEGRAASVAGVAALGVALTGYALGLAQAAAPARPAPDPLPSTAPALVGVAPLYSELPLARRGPNAGFATRLPAPAPDAAAWAALDARQDAAARPAALARRAERRAYDGAPPVIPHPVDPTSVAACLACHERGLRLGAVTAPALPHAAYASCTQCHAPPGPAALADAGPPFGGGDNAFAGLPAPVAGGERAWPGAPPVIPHATWMRQECLACHGPGGSAGLRSTHPWRQSCTQCHAPRASSP